MQTTCQVLCVFSFLLFNFFREILIFRHHHFFFTHTHEYVSFSKMYRLLALFVVTTVLLSVVTAFKVSSNRYVTRTSRHLMIMKQEGNKKWPDRFRNTIQSATKRMSYLLASGVLFLNSQVAVAGRFSKKQMNDNTATITKIDQKDTKKNNKKVVIEVVDDDEDDDEEYDDGEYTIVDVILDNIYSITDEQWNKMGVSVAVISLLYSLIKKDDYKDNKRSRRRGSTNSYPNVNENVRRTKKTVQPKVVVNDNDDENEEEMNTTSTTSNDDDELFDDSTLKAASSKSLGRMSKKAFNMPNNADELFSEGESVDDLFDKKASINSFKDSKEEEVNELVAVKDKKESGGEERKEPKKNKGIFDRIFSKPGGNRETNLQQVLAVDDETSEFRSRVAIALLSYIPAMQELFPYLDNSKNLMNDEERIQYLDEYKDANSDIDIQVLANGYADVASAMLVSLVDNCVLLYDNYEKTKKSNDDDSELLASIDTLGDYIRGAGTIFTQVVPGTVIEPVLYNGKCKSNKLEGVYYRYALAANNISNMLGLLGGQEGAGSGEDVTNNPEALILEARNDKLPLVQQVLNIKEGKRANIESKIMREMMMSMTKGEGGGNLGDMFAALSGGGAGGAGGMGDVNMEELMKNLGGMDGDIDPKNMDPAQMEAMSKDAIDSVKAALSDGSITPDDIKELEKIMGVDVNSIVKMMGNNKNIDKKKLEGMGGDFNEMMEIFQKLSKLK